MLQDVFEYLWDLSLDSLFNNITMAFWACAALIKNFIEEFHDSFANIGSMFVDSVTSSGIFDINFFCDNFVYYIVGFAIAVMLLKLAINVCLAVIEFVLTLVPL